MMIEGVPESGIVVIDKPRGPSSHQVTAWAGKILDAPVGHAGTLDPAVSGVLVVMLGFRGEARPVPPEGREGVCLPLEAPRRCSRGADRGDGEGIRGTYLPAASHGSPR